MGLFRQLKDLIYAKHLAGCMAYSRHVINAGTITTTVSACRASMLIS